ncbi:TetR/AcrR family transcriptional regulator [Pantoea cypripedii]|uniref:TetR family transcriptional regulator n=1 Tax=Pantoea cypripedii TaxID=55209 RepID=A0A6B9GHL9_PANCY|nr:TetR/AcrR family transcriptional regulator [Pantoea cypripedii]QGY32926.1 TetR family transcriptional regulator [Pantoea cypripedii]
MQTDSDEAARPHRARILDAALALTQADGPEAVTTRAVAAAAAVQVPTIYRLFGDKQGLLDAVVEHGIATYVAAKAARTPHPDPVQELRASWDNHVAFGLANPGLFSIMSAYPQSPAVAEGLRFFRKIVRAVATAGRLRTSEEQAVAMIRASCVGLTMMLIADKKSEGGDISRELQDAIIHAVTTDVTGSGPTTQQTSAAALRAGLGQVNVLTKGEVALLDELLERLSKSN